MQCGGWCWDNYTRFFAEKGYHCIGPTLRFHNMDPKEAPDPQLGTTSLLDYVEDLEKEINKFDSPPILMGHSMGGLLAQILGSRGLARALVLLTPAPPRGIIVLKFSAIKSFWNELIRWGFWRKPFRQPFNKAVYSALHLLTVEEQEEVYSKYVYESGRAACEIGIWFFDLKKASKVDESKVTCPVLVIAGAQDRIIPASIVRKIAHKYKDVSTYREFGNHAHWVIGESDWQEITEYISEWLNQVLGESR